VEGIRDPLCEPKVPQRRGTLDRMFFANPAITIEIVSNTFPEKRRTPTICCGRPGMPVFIATQRAGMFASSVAGFWREPMIA
jgi:hypothetical protein